MHPFCTFLHPFNMLSVSLYTPLDTLCARWHPARSPKNLPGAGKTYA